MELASKGGVFKDRIQVLYVQTLIVAPLCTAHMAQPGIDQRESRIAARQTANHTGAVDLPVQPFNDIVGTDKGPVFAVKSAVVQRFFNAVRHLLGSLFQLHGTQLFYHSSGFISSSSFAFLDVNRFEYLDHQLDPI